jgi:HlyD family secretion protein
VDAYPGVTFSGVVTQVRMASTTTSSVVTYPVIIEAENSGGKLYPGMTANISVHIAEARGVLAVSSAAFRYRPPDAGPRPLDDKGSSTKVLYLMVSNAPPQRVEVNIGLTDGTFTEITAPQDLEQREAVLGVSTAPLPERAQGASNPFMPKRVSRSRNQNSAAPKR